MRAAREVDARADIWALGATLYELLTGPVPFEAESLLDLALQIAQGNPKPLREICPEVPWALEQIVSRCLEKDREDRFSSARSLSSALAPFAVRRKGPLLGVVAKAEGGEDSAVESSGDAVTRIAKPPAELVKATAFDAAREEPFFRRAPALRPDEPTRASEGCARAGH